MRFTIRWVKQPGRWSEYKVSRPNYDGGEVVDAEDYDALHAALERIAGLKPRPVLDPHDCEGRSRRIAAEALAEKNKRGPEEGI